VASLTQQLEDIAERVQASKTTLTIYEQNIEDIKQKISERGYSLDNLEAELDAVIDELEHVDRRRKVILDKIKRTMKRAAQDG